MIFNISNDDVSLNKPSNTKEIEKVSPISVISSTQGLPTGGNHFHSQAATTGHNDEVKEKESSEKLEEAVRNLNEHMQVVQRELHFSMNEDNGKIVIKVIDQATKEVIRQIPNEEALNVSRTLGDGVDLKLFSEYT